MRLFFEQPASRSSEVMFASAQQEEIESRCYPNQAREICEAWPFGSPLMPCRDQR
jgi:hypothetical protein